MSIASRQALTDWSGVVHTRARGNVRIASLVPSITETLFALDLAESIVARTGFCVHPREKVRAVAKIGGTKDPDLERLRALVPTHLIVNVDENRREDVDKARAFVPHIVVTHPMTPDDNARLVGLLGAVFDRDEIADDLVRATKTSLAALDAAAQTLPRERVLYLIWRKPWMSVARDTYVSATLERAGWDTLPAHAPKRYPELRDDDSAWRDADRVLLSTEPYAFRERDATALAAVTGKRVHLIDGEWTSWYGARAALGFRSLAEFRSRL
ncbi:MAG TPA: helical backbone metal receptor [Casimicrobiaceae bacterium]|nr:helical backbone metal receptor [Casimicrobiaceae bacterium]